ncbi:MAG: sigma-70 family RNA polymerase sigma factor [Patescibacteria group bacterium]
MHSTPDELIARVQNGETEFFSEVYELFAQKIYAFIFYKTFHRELAEDLTSQTFIRALEKIATFNPKKGSFNSWIYGIARNSVIDHFRAPEKHQKIEDVFDLSSDENISAEFAQKSEFSEVRAALQKLVPRQREIIVLRIWEGYKFREISEILGKSEAAVKMDFFRGIKSLRQEIVVALILLPLTF